MSALEMGEAIPYFRGAGGYEELGPSTECRGFTWCGQPGAIHRAGGDTEAYDAIADNPFLAVRENPLSTSSIDVDTARATRTSAGF